MTTKGKAYWTYGKMEARIKLPTGQGMWPAFWMMPEAWAVSGWPECGEIDIMEAVNVPNWVKSSLHYGSSSPYTHDSSGTSNYYLPGGGSFADDYHVYGMEWEPSVFKFFVDSVQIGSMESWWSDEGPYPAPFNKDFFFILNIAVGGNWPGSPDGTTVFPQQMLIDWVRVYQKPFELTPSLVPGQIEAEDFDPGGEGVAYHDTDAGNNGGAYRLDSDVDIQACSDTGAGYNVGWIEPGEWLEYSVDVTPGTYDILVRVASLSAGGSFHIDFDGVNKTGAVPFSATGDWQNWTTVTISGVTLTGGVQPMRFGSGTDGYNINYIKIQ